jgi:hypothetical protein
MPEQGNLIRVRSITLQQFMDTPLKDKKKKKEFAIPPGKNFF